MNPLLKKEIRLILPAWGLTILLAVASAVFYRHSTNPFDLLVPAWLGVLILCASSFGREFSLGTFSSMLAQPFSRKQYWVIKVGVLVAALFSVLLICFLGLTLAKLVFVDEDGPSAVTIGLLLLAAIAGGLWMALIVRQMMAVIWLIVLVPLGLFLPVLLLLSHFEAADKTVEITLNWLLLAYSVAGIAASWLVFRRAQDVPWSGTTINLPGWMSVGISLGVSSSGVRQPPLRALLRKEFQFNQVALLGMGVLFLLHLGVVGLRYIHRQPDPADSFWREMNSVLTAFGFMWAVVPLIIGCSSIAEERKLGTLEGQLCQPVSARRQFWVKFGFATIVGGCFSALLLFLAEGLAMAVGAAPYGDGVPRHDFAVALSSAGPVMTNIMIALVALAGFGFYASSLTRNLLQALPAAIAAIVGLGFVLNLFQYFSLFHGLVLWNALLPAALVAILLAVVLPWLAYRNFRCLYENARIWRRNSLALAAVLVFAAVASTALYHRAWELFTPFEPAHGPALWPVNQRPVPLRTEQPNNLLISLPDGRYWFGDVSETPADLANRNGLGGLYDVFIARSRTPRLAVSQYLPGPNWVSLTAGYQDVWVGPNSDRKEKYLHIVNCFDTLGIRRDGTLWVTERNAQPAWNTNLPVQFGTETNWQQVLREPTSSAFLLLKNDGTLWRWGKTAHDVPTSPNEPRNLLACTPRRIGTNSDWQALGYFRWNLEAAQKRDGSIWTVNISKSGQDRLTRLQAADLGGTSRQRLDDPKQAFGFGFFRQASIHPDGTLWVIGSIQTRHVAASAAKLTITSTPEGNPELQLGQETNWVAVAVDGATVVALRADGSLWKWGGNFPQIDFFSAYGGVPVRVGIHQDWVALAQTQSGFVSLAADGSLWLWRDDYYFGNSPKLVEPSRRPVNLGNIFVAAK